MYIYIYMYINTNTHTKLQDKISKAELFIKTNLLR